MAKNGKKWPKIAESGRIWPEMAGNVWNWLEMLYTGQKQSGVVRNGHQKWLEGVTGGQKQQKMAQNGHKWMDVVRSGWKVWKYFLMVRNSQQW